MTARHTTLGTFLISSVATFMVTLDNLVVTTSLPVIRDELGASLEALEWTVNAYTLTFAVLLMTGAALGDRFGRRRVFVAGIGVFTLASAAAALAPTAEALIAARALQGLGGAIVTPLALTLLSAAVPPEKRGLALGAWGGIAGLAVALGPMVGGAVVEGASWQWIFWLNVPIGLALMPFAARRLPESRGPDATLDLGGVALLSGGLLGVVWGIVRGHGAGWTSPEVTGALTAGVALTAAFLAWERRTPAPMLPLRLFRDRTFAAANLASLSMYFGLFGVVFLLAQFLQIVQGYSPLEAGLRTLPWTAMPVLVAPLAGMLSDRIGGRPLMATGLLLQAHALGWIAVVTTPGVDYGRLVPPFVLAGVGMSLFFAPVAGVVLSAVRPAEEGRASGVNTAVRELGGVLGVAVLATVFAAAGGYETATGYVDGLVAATWIGAAVVGIGALAALAIPAAGRRGAGIVARPATATS